MKVYNNNYNQSVTMSVERTLFCYNVCIVCICY